MSRMDRYTKKNKKFKKFYLAYVAVLLLLIGILFLYVRGLMVKYERNSPENYVIWLTENVSDSSPLGKYLKEKNFSDNRFSDGSQRKDNFYARAKSGTLEVKPVKGAYRSTCPVYDVSSDGKALMMIAIEELSSKTKLGIMTLSDWEIKYCIVKDENSDSKLEISENDSINIKAIVPDNFDLIIDGKPDSALNASSEMVLPDFEYISQFVEAPKGRVYEINDLYYEPHLSVQNNVGEIVDLSLDSDGFYTVLSGYKESAGAKTLINSFCDPLELGKLWSKYMTDDVPGDMHGRNTVISGCKLLKGTDLYKLAVNWASSIDITFVSGHTITSWTNESVSNYIQYNDNFLSCDVTFDKNMNVRGSSRVDSFRNRMYFGKINGAWYLLDMVTLDSK